MIGKAVDDVALRNDAVDPLAVFADDKGADIAVAQRGQRRRYRLIGTDRCHRPPLPTQDCFDIHVTLAGRCAAGTGRRPNPE